MPPARAGRALHAESRRYPVTAVAAGPHRPNGGSTSRGRRRRQWRSREFLFVRGNFISTQPRWECYVRRYSSECIQPKSSASQASSTGETSHRKALDHMAEKCPQGDPSAPRRSVPGTRLSTNVILTQCRRALQDGGPLALCNLLCGMVGE